MAWSNISESRNDYENRPSPASEPPLLRREVWGTAGLSEGAVKPDEAGAPRDPGATATATAPAAVFVRGAIHHHPAPRRGVLRNAGSGLPPFKQISGALTATRLNRRLTNPRNATLAETSRGGAGGENPGPLSFSPPQRQIPDPTRAVCN